MIVKLPIPIKAGAHIVKSIDLGRPKVGGITDASEQFNEGNPYKGFERLIGPCIKKAYSAGDVEINDAICSGLAGKMSSRTAALVATLIASDLAGTDKISGNYTCGECGHVSHHRETDEGDGRISLEDLHVGYANDPVEEITLRLKYPIKINRNKDGIDAPFTVIEMIFKVPTLEDSIVNSGKFGIPLKAANSETSTWIGCIKSITTECPEQAEEITNTWKCAYGKSVFALMDVVDRDALSEISEEYGLDPTLTVACPNCGEETDHNVNVNVFFSALVGRRKRKKRRGTL